MPIVGDPDGVVEKMSALSEAGISTLALGLPHDLMELPYFRDGVLPRLESMGPRVPAD